MTTTDAIKRAISGGYRPYTWMTDKTTIEEKEHGDWAGLSFVDDGKYVPVNRNNIFLDPAFWQCLGVAEGWARVNIGGQDFDTDHKNWVHHWIQFIYALADGKTSDEYFQELLK